MGACAAAGIVAVAVIVWKTPLRPELAPAAPAPAATSAAPPPAATADAPAQTPPLGSGPPQSVGAVAALAVAPKAVPKAPEFDVVRVEKDGAAVVAGRAAAGSIIELMAGASKVGETKVDANGQFAIAAVQLPPGDHVLSLRAANPGAPATVSTQSVAVSVAPKAGGASLAALTEPGKPTRVLSDLTPAAASGAKPAIAPIVAVRTAEAGAEGAFYATGVAPPGASVRIYLNDALVAGVVASPDGKWALKVERGMAAGHYDVRADVADAAGKVAARAQVPFDYPATAPPRRAPANEAAAQLSTPPIAQATAPAFADAALPAGVPSAPSSGMVVAASPPQSATVRQPVGAPAPASTGANPSTATATSSGVAIVPEINSVTVVRGDSLWRISQKVLGSGVRYTQIYEANAKQIRDPDLIYPGQIFVAPAPVAN